MNRRPEDELDALLSGGGDNPALSRALASLRDLGTGPAPAPSAELSALFGSNVVPLRRRRRRGPGRGRPHRRRSRDAGRRRRVRRVHAGDRGGVT